MTDKFYVDEIDMEILFILLLLLFIGYSKKH